MPVSNVNSMVPATFNSGEFKLPDIVGKQYGNVADAAAEATRREIGKSLGLPDFIVHNLPPLTQNEKDVIQLDRAEALARDAFGRVLNPNANRVDKLEAQEEMQEAEKIRKEVEKHLDPQQRKAVEAISEEEKDAVNMASNADRTLEGWGRRLQATKEMKEAHEESGSLNSWILNNPIKTIR